MNAYIIGINGGSGSGKTTLIKELRERFSEKELCLISMDNYYKPNEALTKDENGVVNYDLPSCFNNEAFLSDLKRLKAGQVVTLQEYVFNDERTESRTLEFRPAPIVVIEGIFIFNEISIWELLNLKVFIHAKDHLKIIRRIRRDQNERHYPIDDVLYRFENHIVPAYEQFILPYKDVSDIVINNNDSYRVGFEVLAGFIDSKLNS